MNNAAASALDATTPTWLYINPRRRARITDGHGLRCCITSWQRTSDNAIPIRLKCGANYQNGRLATLQAKADGYDAPILLNQHGTVAEGSGATFHGAPRPARDAADHQRHPRVHHPHHPDRRCGAGLGMEVVERDIARTELYVADEAFFCGSGYEITPILSVDKFPLGDGGVGPITQRLLTAYMNVVRGADRRFPSGGCRSTSPSPSDPSAPPTLSPSPGERAG